MFCRKNVSQNIYYIPVLATSHAVLTWFPFDGEVEGDTLESETMNQRVKLYLCH